MSNKDQIANARFNIIIDEAESGNEDARETLRVVMKKVCEEAPIEDVIKMADLILRMQRAACEQEKKSE